MPMPRKQYNTIGSKTKEELQEIATRVTTMAGFLREVGLLDKRAGSNYQTAKKYLQKHSINTDHWKGQAWNKDNQQKDWSQYRNNNRLRINLVRERGHMCQICQNASWLNNPITLELHHVDGNRVNNQLNNLMLLCPNCHSQTDNYRNRKRVDLNI
jgi:hypothetical protein